jgi:hypothetical protein
MLEVGEVYHTPQGLLDRDGSQRDIPAQISSEIMAEGPTPIRTPSAADPGRTGGEESGALALVSPTQWEYKLEELGAGAAEVTQRLNDESAEGWDLVTVLPVMDGVEGSSFHRLVFRRKHTNPTWDEMRLTRSDMAPPTVLRGQVSSNR